MIVIVSKPKKGKAIPKNAVDAYKEGTYVDRFHLRNNSSGFVVEYENGFKEFMLADEIAEEWASNGKLAFHQVIPFLNEKNQAVSKGGIVLRKENGAIVTNLSGDWSFVVLTSEVLNELYKIELRPKDEK